GIARTVVHPHRRTVPRLSGAGGFRLRRRHADGPARRGRRGRSGAPAPGRAQHDRPGLGRQRGVADHRGRIPVRGIPQLVRPPVLGAVPAVAGDPVRDGRAHRRHRVAAAWRRPAAAAGEADPAPRRRAVLNTIGPVWDANEVWLITAGASMFAAFPNWYATLFSALYLPLLAILFGMIVRIVGIEWRGKIDDERWRKWADAGIAVGSWLPAVLWGVAFAILLRGLPIDADGRAHPGLTDVLNGYTLLGGLATASLFAFYGAVFVALKTAGS